MQTWPRDPDGALIYPGRRDAMTDAERKKRMADGEPYALRLDMDAAISRVGRLTWSEAGRGPGGESGEVAARPQAWGDVTLARKDVPTSYHLSVVIDDALQGVTQVVRGQDLFWSTSVHRLLQALLGLSLPDYRHHRLMLDADGRKLSKSTHATALRALRSEGRTPTDIRKMVGLPEG
jgi:glutamyl-Q tRNA(Asp) synthetase